MDQANQVIDTPTPQANEDEPKEENRFLTLLVFIVLGVFISILAVFYILSSKNSKNIIQTVMPLKNPVTKSNNLTTTPVIKKVNLTDARFMCPVNITPCPESQSITGKDGYVGLLYILPNQSKIIAVDGGIVQIADSANYKDNNLLSGRRVVSLSVPGIGLFAYSIPNNSNVVVTTGDVKKGAEIATINGQDAKLSFSLFSGTYINLSSTPVGVQAK